MAGRGLHPRGQNRGRRTTEDDGRQGTMDDRGRWTTEDDEREGTTDGGGRRTTEDDGGRRTTKDDGGRRTTDDSTPATLGATLGTQGRGGGRQNGVAGLSVQDVA